MKKALILAIITVFLASPALAGSLKISSTDQSGRTTTIKKTYPQKGAGAHKAGTRGKGYQGRRGSGPAASPPSEKAIEKARIDTLFKTTTKMITDINKTMDMTVEEFKKDAKGSRGN